MNRSESKKPEKFRQIFESSRDAIMLIGPEGYIDCNEATLKLFNVETKAKFKRLTPWELAPPTQPDGSDSKKTALEHIERAMNEGEDFFEWCHQRSDGESFPAEVKLSSFKLDDQKIVQALVREITERKQRENNLNKLNQKLKFEVEQRKQAEREVIAQKKMLEGILDNIPDVVAIQNPDHTVERYNHSGYDMLDMTEEEVKGKKCWELLGRTSECEECATKKALQTGELAQVEKYVPEVDRYLDCRSSPIFDQEGNIVRVIEQLRDITDRKEYEKNLENSLREKNILLKEVHHRVKNNMQIISSILMLQAHYVDDERLSRIVKECNSRIRSMALVHEKLYRSDDLSEIDFQGYVEELIDNIFSSHHGIVSNIEKVIDIHGVRLDIDTSIACGLILQELISNSLQHGFSDGETGKLEIYFDLIENKNGDKMYKLEVSDTGSGINDDVDVKSADSLGLQLVASLVEDNLAGEFKVTTEEGTTFKITFPARG